MSSWKNLRREKIGGKEGNSLNTLIYLISLCSFPNRHSLIALRIIRKLHSNSRPIIDIRDSSSLSIALFNGRNSPNTLEERPRLVLYRHGVVKRSVWMKCRRGEIRRRGWSCITKAIRSDITWWTWLRLTSFRPFRPSPRSSNASCLMQ